MGDLPLRHLHLRGVTVITVGGELDIMTAPRLEAFVRQVRRPGDQVVFDLTGVTFLDCSGLRILLRVHREACQDGGTAGRGDRIKLALTPLNNSK